MSVSDCVPDSRVQKWLESIPEGSADVCLALSDVDLNLDAADASNNVKFFGCKGFPVKSAETKPQFLEGGNNTCANEKSKMYLQGCPCTINASRSKTDISTSKKDKSARKVTFRFSESIVDAGYNFIQETKHTPSQSRARKAPEDARYALHRGMREYLQEIARKRSEKLGTRELSYLSEDTPSLKETEEGDNADEHDCGGKTQNRQPENFVDRQPVTIDGGVEDLRFGTFDDIVCVGRQEKVMSKWTELKKPTPYAEDSHQELSHRVRLPPWGSKTQQLPRRIQVNRRVLEKPIIKGLVVDSATNQQPSIVRASKNANIREEYALKTRIGGYVKECCLNIKNIRIAQRKLTTNLAFLKTKMAANRSAKAEHRNNQTSCGRSEAPEPFVKKAFPLVFPPLVYRNRRVLTVS